MSTAVDEETTRRAAEPQPPDATPPPPRTRDPWFDNARAILITLVVVGHLLETMSGPAANAAYLWIYSFHMPAFVLVSGFLSRNFTGSPRQAKGLVATLLVPFVVFQTVHAVESWYLTGSFSTDVLVPTFALWFLLALFAWRITTPVLKVLRYPVLFAVVVYLTVPFDDSIGKSFTLGRIFGFLPFFVLGIVLRPEHFQVLRTKIAAFFGAAFLVLALAMAWVLGDTVQRGQLYLAGSYSSLEQGWHDGPVLRLATLAVGLAGTAAVLALSPRVEIWPTRLGRNSLTVYLLQSALLYPILKDSTMSPLAGALATAGVALAGVLITVVLGTNTVERATRWLVRPPTGWMLTRERA